MYRDADLVPVVDHPAVFLKHLAPCVFKLHSMLPVVSILIFGREVQIVGIERFDSHERLVTTRPGCQFNETPAAAMLGRLALPLSYIGITGGVNVYLYHEAQGWKLPLHCHQTAQDFLPSRTS